MTNQGSDSAKTSRRWLLAILTLALVLRLIAACGLQYLLDHRWHRPFLISGDAEGYWLLAQKIAAGEDYAIYTPPRYVLRMPGFPALLAIPISLFGPSLFAARLFLAGVGTLTCALVYQLGRQMFNRLIGLIAAALAAVSPVLIVFTETVLSETSFALTLLASLCLGHSLYLRVDDSRSSWGAVLGWGMFTGIALAAGVMMRPSWILAAPIVAVLLLLTTQHRWRSIVAGGVVIAAMVLTLWPWGIRNEQVTGHFTLTTFWMGPSLYDGLNPEATGDSNMAFYDRDRLMERKDEYEVDQHYRRAAWKWAREHPARVARLAAIKAKRYFSPWPNAAQFSQPWMKWGVSLFFVPMFGLGVWGGICLFRRPQNLKNPEQQPPLRQAIWSMAILTGPILYFALIHMVFVSSLRYRLPAEYSWLVLSAVGLQHLWNQWYEPGAHGLPWFGKP